jgi:hypothetical protein
MMMHDGSRIAWWWWWWSVGRSPGDARREGSVAMIGQGVCLNHERVYVILYWMKPGL